MLLAEEKDLYNCVRAMSQDSRTLNDNDFVDALKVSIQKWKDGKVHGIWFKVSLQDSRFIAFLADEGFVFHHAQPDYVMMSRWLPQHIPCSLPRYPFMQIGCGGLVVDDEGRVLLMREKKGFYLGWKYPGGLADPNENIYETAAREVKEETGVDVEGIAVLSIRQIAAAKWKDTNDLYWLCVMRPRKDGNVKVQACPHETAEARWMTRKEISELPEEMFHMTLHDSLKQYDEWVARGGMGLRMRTEHSPFRKMDMHVFIVD